MTDTELKADELDILIVDDDPGTIQVLSGILKDVARIHFTTRGGEALDMALEVKPHLILLDVEMPDANGIDVCELIKNDAALKHQAILFVTIHNDAGTEKRALQAGGLDVIHKPPHPEVVKARVKNYLDWIKSAEKLHMLTQAAEQSLESIVITDIQGNIEFVNATFEQTSGYSRQELIGQNSNILKSGKTSPETYRELWHALTNGRSWSGKFTNRRKDGSEYLEFATISPIRIGPAEVTHYLAVKLDITEHYQAKREIERLGYFDSLTGMANRKQLNDRLQAVLAICMRHGQRGALLFIDLDNFKLLNDTRGYELGDRLILEVSERLRNSLRLNDFLARTGGDEFALLIDNLPRQEEAAIQVETVAKHVISTIGGKPFLDAAQSYAITASIGICLFSGTESETSDEVLKRAETAMYRAKTVGRGSYAFFDPTIQTALEQRALLEEDLRKALSLEQFFLLYQPQLDDRGCVLGVEALLRWQHPVRGTVAPSEFIPLLEETGLIVPVGNWVLKTAIQQLCDWNGNPTRANLRLSVNVSARQFHETQFVDDVNGVIDESGIYPKNLTLELTESLVLDHTEDSIAKMQSLKQMGVEFSMDDFGTGYSSFSYLKRLPLTEIKIDKSFVRDIVSDSNDEIIVQTIIAMAGSLGLIVIAEGVENSTQMEILRKHGCRRFQGYFIGHPQPAAQIDSLLSESFPDYSDVLDSRARVDKPASSDESECLDLSLKHDEAVGNTRGDYRIVIIDDNPGTIRLLTSILAGFGDIHATTDGGEAIELSKEVKPDLILLDIELGGINGIDVCLKLKEDAELKEIPVIFITSHTDSTLEAIALSAGAIDFIHKPLNAATARSRVVNQLVFKRQQDQLRKISTTDSLTRLVNRRGLEKALHSEWKRACRNGNPLSVLMMDLDYFKRFNDTYGHPKGDELLSVVAGVISKHVKRPGEISARFGGEEFVVILPNSDLQDAENLSEMIRKEVSELVFSDDVVNDTFSVTISIGVATMTTLCATSSYCWRKQQNRENSCRCTLSPAHLIKAADDALYLAKKRGRNQVALFKGIDLE